MPATPRAPLGDVSNSPATGTPTSARKRRAAPIDASTGRTPIHAHPRSRAAIAPHGRRALCQMLSASPPSAAARGVAADLLGAGLRAAEWHSPVEEDVDLASVGASFRTSSPSVAASVSVASEASVDSPHTAGVKQDFLDGITSDGESESESVREPAPAPANESLSVEAQVWAQEQELAELMDELQPPEGCPPAAPASQSLRRAFLETASSAAMPSPVMRGSNQPDAATEDGSGEGPSPTVGERSTRREAFLRKELKETWLTSGEKFIAERAVSSIEQMPERQRQQQDDEGNEGNEEAAQMRYEDIMAKLDSAIAVAPDAASRDYLGQLHAQLTAFNQQIHDADAELEAAEGRFTAQGDELAQAREAAAEAEGKCAALHLQLSEQMTAQKQKQTAQQQPEPASGSGSSRGRSASPAGGGCCGSRPRRE